MKNGEIAKIVFDVLAGLNRAIKGPVMPAIEEEVLEAQVKAVAQDVSFLTINKEADAKALYEEQLIVTEQPEPKAFAKLKEKEKLPLYITVAVVRSVEGIQVGGEKPEELDVSERPNDWSQANRGSGHALVKRDGNGKAI